MFWILESSLFFCIVPNIMTLPHLPTGTSFLKAPGYKLLFQNEHFSDTLKAVLCCFPEFCKSSWFFWHLLISRLNIPDAFKYNTPYTSFLSVFQLINTHFKILSADHICCITNVAYDKSCHILYLGPVFPQILHRFYCYSLAVLSIGSYRNYD